MNPSMKGQSRLNINPNSERLRDAVEEGIRLHENWVKELGRVTYSQSDFIVFSVASFIWSQVKGRNLSDELDMLDFLQKITK